MKRSDWPFGILVVIMRKVIQTSDAPKAIGMYSQGIIAGGFVFTSGQIAIEPVSGEIITNDFKNEVRQVMNNLSAVLISGGSSLKYVVKCTVFLKDLNRFPELNEVFGEFFSDMPPARSAVEVCKLPKDVTVEIEAIGKIIE